MWDLPGPGIEPMFPALAGRFLTTGPPGKFPFFLRKALYSLFFPKPGAHRSHLEATDGGTVIELKTTSFGVGRMWVFLLLPSLTSLLKSQPELFLTSNTGEMQSLPGNMGRQKRGTHARLLALSLAQEES